ncbi:N-acetylmuramoyl-L-alanine amidase [Helicovermis profundi]|uniref:MurNAc-LAA domain-containing protein n=1 Tax=Helicovermis profundi TaxID=3065157 RepID=A0AAU9E6W2_9FIRM|nr:hypothetical protein HLPR_21960 [Clostridia bacterium S502]
MRKIVFVVIISLIFNLSIPLFTYGESSTDISENINLLDSKTNKTQSYPVVNLMLSGEDLVTDVPGILYSLGGYTRTLVPISIITDNLGYDILWDGKTKEVTITTESKTIVLKINSSDATINGEKIKLPNDIPAKLMAYNGTYRTMVPVRFVTEQLGKEIKWINDTRTVEINEPKQYIKSIVYDRERHFKEIRIKTSGKVKTTSYYIDGTKLNKKNKYVVDIQNVDFKMDKINFDKNGYYKIPIELYGIDSANMYKIKDTGNIRLEVNLDIKKGFDVFYDDKSGELVVEFINSVEDIRYEKLYNADAIVIDTNQAPPDLNVKYLKNAVIVDIVNSKLKFNSGKFGSIDFKKDGIEKVSFSQFDPSNEYEKDDLVSRVVVNLSEGKTSDDVYVEDIGDKVYIYVSGAPLNGFNYVKNGLDSGTLDINFDKKGSYKTNYDSNSKLLTLEVPKSSINLDKMNVDIDDSIVDLIKIDDMDMNNYLISLKLSKGTSYKNNSEKNNIDNISLSFFNKELSNSKYKNTLVVIDPGHGGSDAGAVGSKTYEKTLALIVGKKVKKELESLGFKVYITRDNDKRVSLQERTNIANSLGADLFVSIHMNSYVNANPYGLEVLYNPNDKLKNKEFAEFTKNELINSLGAFDRGIVSRPRLYVLRHTEMPSILTELGFISNPTEQDKLMNVDYQTKAAKAIAKGILDFLSFK